MTTGLLSVVIPAYNEHARIGATLDRLLHYLRERGTVFEVLVVDDGSTDDTVATVDARSDAAVRVIRLPRNQGKGAAVRRGMLATRGNVVLLTDADLSAPIAEIQRLEAALQNGYDAACGSRGLARSTVARPQPVHRRQMGNVFNRLIRLLRLTKFRDTQCGFKLFRGGMARDVFARCSIEGFAFDVECLLVAQRLGYRVIEVPVEWSHVPESRVRITVDASRMLWDVLRLRVVASRAGFPPANPHGSPTASLSNRGAQNVGDE